MDNCQDRRSISVRFAHDKNTMMTKLDVLGINLKFPHQNSHSYVNLLKPITNATVIIRYLVQKITPSFMMII